MSINLPTPERVNSPLHFLPGQRGHVLVERFLAKVKINPVSGCHLWDAARDQDGYGRFTLGHRRQRMAHRMAYIYFVGPIPPGAEIEHRCHTEDESCDGTKCVHRGCVNPHHLEPLDHRRSDNRWDDLCRGELTVAEAKQSCTCGGTPTVAIDKPYQREKTLGWHWSCDRCGASAWSHVDPPSTTTAPQPSGGAV